jgi:PPK2 family polyphosphate:nucleotide phosphotransferase
MKSIEERLRVEGKKVKLSDWKPGSTPGCKNEQEALERVAVNCARIDEIQYSLYAEGRQSLLIVLQGMDTSGKDGVIRKVLSAFNAQGCRVWPFKVPTSEEARHDFLWRIHKAAPAQGEVSVFNRSHYEDVLVVRVHKLVPKGKWSLRFGAINAFEEHLREHGTRVIKFYLHISKDEQKARLLKRLENKAKHWKFNEGDLEERRHWDEYAKAYADVLRRCSPKRAPWYVIPADHKWYRDLAISEIVLKTLESMDPKTPKVEDLDVKKLRAQLNKA